MSDEQFEGRGLVVIRHACLFPVVGSSPTTLPLSPSLMKGRRTR